MTQALADLDDRELVVAGDLVKSQSGFAEYAGGVWYGSLGFMEPGSGYKLLLTSEVDSAFTYPYVPPVPLPIAMQGAYSPDQKHMAYVAQPGAFQVWKRYRGGMASAIWIADLADSSLEKLPREVRHAFNGPGGAQDDEAVGVGVDGDRDPPTLFRILPPTLRV